MQSRKKITTVIAGALLALSITSCEKPAGPGGNATVRGRVIAKDFDNTQRYMISEGYAVGERVYIIYGNEGTVGNDERTSSDGTFEFRYLTKGRYKIFVNSLDTSIKMKGNKTFKPVFREFEITERKQVVNLQDIIINK